MQDHVGHSLHLHALDLVDVVSALKADPDDTSKIAQSISRWPRNSPEYFRDLQARLTQFMQSQQLGIFANGYWGHPAYLLPSQVNLIGVTTKKWAPSSWPADAKGIGASSSAKPCRH